MQVLSVETLKGLERKVKVSIPAEKMQSEINARLRELRQKVSIPGFRPGKVPESVIKTRYADSIRFEVSRKLVETTLPEALKECKLEAAGVPSIEPEQIENDKDFIYTAQFEVFPEVSLNPIPDEEIELVKSKVTDKDLNSLIEKLRDQNKNWETVDRAVAEGDKVSIDFKGSLNGEPFEGGSAENYELIIGSGMMIPGFETAIIGAKV